MAKEAGTQALKDARITYKDIEQVAVGYVYGQFPWTLYCSDTCQVIPRAGSGQCMSSVSLVSPFTM